MDGVISATEKFMGVGITNAMAISAFTMFLIIMLKVIFTKYEVPGISEAIRTI